MKRRAEPSDAPSPTVIEGVTDLERIGSGGFSVVYRGREGAMGVLTLERLGVGASFEEDEFELVQLFAAQVSIASYNRPTIPLTVVR